LDVVRVLRITQGASAVEAVALSCQAVLEALRGRSDAARRMIASSRKMVEDLGITQRLLEADVFGGLIDLLEGDAAAAERNLRRALAVARRASGRGREADAEEQRAIALWEAKGATLLADGARRRGTAAPENDRPPLPKGDHREVARPAGPPPGPRLAKGLS